MKPKVPRSITTAAAVRWAGSAYRLAALLGVTRQAISQWGTHPPKSQQVAIRRLQAALGPRRKLPRGKLALEVDRDPELGGWLVYRVADGCVVEGGIPTRVDALVSRAVTCYPPRAPR